VKAIEHSSVYISPSRSFFITCLYIYEYTVWYLRQLNEVRNGVYEDVSKSFRTGRLERELQMVQLLALGAVVSLFCESV